MEMILTGEPATAAELEKYGVVTRALPAEEVLDAALKCARTIAAKSGPVIQIAKQAMLAGASLSLSLLSKPSHTKEPIAERSDFVSGLDIERSLYYVTYDFEDKKEGMRAFLEKRAPVFQHK